MSSIEPARIAIRGLSKTFHGQRALDDVSLTVRPGEVHALLGQNGSGKSTLIKILAGYHLPDPGAAASVDGRPFELGSPTAAHAAGIRFIHQDLALIPELSVADNLALGGSYHSNGWVSDRQEAAITQRLLDEWRVDVDARAPVHTLGQADRTMVAIVRAVRDGISSSGILVLDEPTAALPRHEVEYMAKLVQQLRDRGASILYVTHRLSEVFRLADSVTVLRDGRVTGSRPVSGMDHDDLVAMIVGRALGSIYPDVPTPRNNAILIAERVSGAVTRDFSLHVRECEIVGVAGLTGSGREEVADLLFGTRDRLAGVVTVDGVPVRGGAPRDAIARGLALLPADRKGIGSIPSLTVRENVTLPAIVARRAFWLSDRAERKDVAGWLARLGVVPRDPERPLSTLSGGNQQRALIARWLRRGSRIFLMDEPTQGVDIQAKVAIYAAIRDAAKEGSGVVVASTDNDELAAICDRVVVLRDGRVVKTLTGADLTAEAILEHSIERVSTLEGS